MRRLLLALAFVAVPMASALAVPIAPLAADRAVAHAQKPLAENVACWAYRGPAGRVRAGCARPPVYYGPPAYYRPPVYYRPPLYAGPVVVVPRAYAPHRRCWINGGWRFC